MKLSEFLFRDDTCASCGHKRSEQKEPDYDADNWRCDRCGFSNRSGSGDNAPDPDGRVEWPFGRA